MVKGLDLFSRAFEPFQNQYVLIGGTAATLRMEEEALPFRATKDLDLVLHVEALTPDFGAAFWAFVDAGGYEIRQVGDSGKCMLYRFQKPRDPAYPAMLELFSRVPDSLRPGSGQFTRIPFEEAVASLSAIVLDDEYYRFILAARNLRNGLAFIGEDRLIPLKAIAWLDLSERKARGEKVDSNDVRKHARDVLRLSMLFTEQTRIALPPRIAGDMRQFLARLVEANEVRPADMGINEPLPALAERIARAYGLHAAAT